jgi:two-component system nitrogen regulation response regulator GlnG
MAEPLRAWVTDDDETIRFVLRRALKRAGYEVETFATVGALNEALGRGAPDVILTDIRLPDADGLTVLETLRAQERDIPVIAMTGFSDLDQAVNAFQKGVFDYLPKPFDLEQVLSTVASAVAQRPAPAPTAKPAEKSRMIGESQAMQEIFRTIGRLSRSSISVLITGETGSGKEVVARALHEHSPRADGPFVAINTAAVPSELLESELFGHERGAFTGAHTRRHGRFEEAAGGTLFLDEIGDMPLGLQTRLLRVLAEGDYYRVGGRDLLQADVRVIAATHQDLEALIRRGAFREDLYHRLNVITIELPPLRERRDDIPALATHFLQQAARDMGLEVKVLRPETLERLRANPWPGNVRQLQNVCRQLCVMAPGEQVFPEDLPDDLDERNGGAGGEQWQDRLREWAREALRRSQPELMSFARDELERVLFEAALEKSGGRRAEAARLLGVGRNTLARKLKALGEKSPGGERQGL